MVQFCMLFYNDEIRKFYINYLNLHMRTVHPVYPCYYRLLLPFTTLITTFYRMSSLKFEIHVASCQSTTAVCQVTFGFCILPLIHSQYLMHEEKMNE